jgi:hypothetical protein
MAGRHRDGHQLRTFILATDCLGNRPPHCERRWVIHPNTLILLLLRNRSVPTLSSVDSHLPQVRSLQSRSTFRLESS